MNMRYLVFSLIAFAFAALVSFGTAQAAARSIYHGGNYFGNVDVPAGQVVEGDLNVVFGNATIEGTVNGDVNVFGGSIDTRGGGTVTGEQHAVGGDVAQSIVPWAPSDAASASVYAPDYRIWWRIAWDVVVLVFFLIFPLRTRMAVDRLEHHPALAAAVGLFGWVAVLPLAFLLAITLVLIPLIFVEAIAVTAGVFVGTAALALLVGRRFYELVQPHATPTPLVALILGLALVTAAQLVPVVGVFVTLLAALIGLGAVMLTFISSNPAPGVGMPPRAPIGGPPMPIG